MNVSTAGEQGMDALVTQSDDVAWGAAVVSGTRVPVDTLFEYHETGESLDDFLKLFPTVPRDTAVVILERAKVKVAAGAVSGDEQTN